MLVRGLIIIAMFALSTGCASHSSTHFDSFPTTLTEFELCPEDLRAKYSDINRFDGPYTHGFFGSIYSLPPIEELIKEWGDPDQKRISWWNLEDPVYTAAIGIGFGWPGAVTAGLAVFSLVAIPTSIYTWNKGHYSINCVVDHPMAFGYDPHLDYWRWEYKGPSCPEKSTTR